MKNKKVLIIVVVIIIVLAVIMGIIKIYNSYLFSQDGTISDGHDELIEHLQNIDDEAERKNQIDYSVEQNIITQEEANELY